MNTYKSTVNTVFLGLLLIFLTNQLYAQLELKNPHRRSLSLVSKISNEHGLKVRKIEDVDSLYFLKKWFYVHCTDGTTKIYDAQNNVLESETILNLHVLDYFNFINISISKTIDGKKQWLIYDRRFSRMGWKPVRINFEVYDTIYYADPFIEYPDFIGVKNNQYTFFKVDDEHAKVNFKTNLKLKDENFSLVNLKKIIPFHAGFIASFLKNDSISYKKIRWMSTNYSSIAEIDPITKDTINKIVDTDSLGYFTIDKNFDADEIIQLPKPGYTNAIIKKNHILHVYNFRQNKIIYSGLTKYDLACGELPVIYTHHGFLFENEHYIQIPTHNIKSINYKKIDNDIIGMVQMNMEVNFRDKKKFEQNWEINFTQKTIKDLSKLGADKLPLLYSTDSFYYYYNKKSFLNFGVKKSTEDLKPKRTLLRSKPYNPWINIKLADEYFLKNEYDSALKYNLLDLQTRPSFSFDYLFKNQFGFVMETSRILLEEVDHDYLQKELSLTNPEYKKLLCSFYYAITYAHSENSYRPIEVELQALSELIKQNEAVSEFYFYRGILFANLKMYPDAMADFDKLIKLNASNNNYLRRSFYALRNIQYALSKKDKIDVTFAQLPISDISYVIENVAKEPHEKNYRLFDLYTLRAELNYYLRGMSNRSFKDIKKEICFDLNKSISFYELPENIGNSLGLSEKKSLQKKCKCKE